MKIYTILTVAALAGMLTSCVKEIPVECTQDEGRQLCRITGAIVNNPETKTYMGAMANNGTNDYYPVYWSDGDEIAVFSKTSVGTFALNQVNPDDDDPDLGRTYATFVGDAGDMPIKFEGSDVYPAAYPVDGAFAQISPDGNLFVGSYLPNIQHYKNGTFEDNVFPMASASTNGETFPFYNLCGVVQLRLWGEPDENGKNQVIQSIFLTGNNDEVVAGGIGMKFDPTTGEPITDGVVDGDKNNGKLVATYGSEGYTRVILDFSTQTYDPDETPDSGDEIHGLALSTEENNPTIINIAVIPQAFTSGITVEMRDGRNMGQSFKTIDGAEVIVKRSKVTRMARFKYEKPEALQVANSYVYDHAGYYVMPAYAMGNRMDVKLPTEGRNLAADLLWSELITVNTNTTDRNDLKPAVTNIEYLSFDDGNGMLQFKINIDPNTEDPYRGNAAIALYDADTKEVIWSWHIWMSEPVHDVVTGGTCADGTYSYELPDGTKVDYAAEASSGQLIIMDRNLGAISANPADGWKTYGLYYQNGRRDPFIGGHWDGDPNPGTRTEYKNQGYDNLKIREDEAVPFTVGATDTAPVWYNEDLAERGWYFYNHFQNVSTALRNPMTFSSGYNSTDKNSQWTLYTDPDNKSWLDPNAGGNNKKKGGDTSGGVHGNTGLSDGGHEAYWNRTKTIMDPCPVGYSVLGERGGLFLGNSDSKTYRWETNTDPAHSVYGMMSTYIYNGIPYNTWWPAAGVRTITGKLGDVGYRGMYYHYDHISATHGGHGSGFDHNPNNWETGIMTNHAASVRCVREKQFSDLTKYPLK